MNNAAYVASAHRAVSAKRLEKEVIAIAKAAEGTKYVNDDGEIVAYRERRTHIGGESREAREAGQRGDAIVARYSIQVYSITALCAPRSLNK